MGVTCFMFGCVVLTKSNKPDEILCNLGDVTLKDWQNDSLGLKGMRREIIQSHKVFWNLEDADMLSVLECLGRPNSSEFYTSYTTDNDSFTNQMVIYVIQGNCRDSLSRRTWYYIESSEGEIIETDTFSNYCDSSKNIRLRQYPPGFEG